MAIRAAAVWMTMAAVIGAAAPAAATSGACDEADRGPIAAVGATVRSAKKISDRTWRKHVADFVYTTDGIWGPSVKEMKKVKPRDLNACLTNIYKGEQNVYGTESVDVWTAKVDGRSIYLFQSDGDGFTASDLRDAKCRTLKMGDRKHDPVPLPFPAEASPLPSRGTWIAHLKESVRHVTAMSDTPVVALDTVPAKVRTAIEKRRDKWAAGENGNDPVDVEVHQVRLEGRTSYWVAYGMFDGVGYSMYDPNGKELDVQF